MDTSWHHKQTALETGYQTQVPQDHKDHKDPLVPLEPPDHKDHKDHKDPTVPQVPPDHRGRKGHRAHKEQQLLFLAVFQMLMLCILLVDPTILKDFLIIIFQQP